MLQPHLTNASSPDTAKPRATTVPSTNALIRRAAFDLLAMREHTQQELVEKLLRKFKKRSELHITEQAVTEAVLLINAEGLQSDQRYIEMLVRSRINQGHGPVRIAQELKQKGIQQSAFEMLLDGGDEQWLALAKQARQKKFGNDMAVDPRQKARQMRFLQYRGFTSRQIQYALNSNNNNNN